MEPKGRLSRTPRCIQGANVNQPGLSSNLMLCLIKQQSKHRLVLHSVQNSLMHHWGPGSYLGTPWAHSQGYPHSSLTLPSTTTHWSCQQISGCLKDLLGGRPSGSDEGGAGVALSLSPHVHPAGQGTEPATLRQSFSLTFRPPLPLIYATSPFQASFLCWR